MVKPLLLVAIAAHILVLASSTKRYRRNNHYKVSPRKVFPCPKDEIWASCPEAVCAPKTCDDVGYEVPCLDLSQNGTCPSKAHCICKEGFVRSYKGHCIPMELCPSCGGDPNAQSGCGTSCNRLCSNYFKKDVFCTDQCYYNACDCKEGFVLDEIRDKCVRPNQCRAPVKCKRKNEVYDPCPSSCPSRTCGINDAAVSCGPALPNGHPKCPKPTCRCRDGFYRNHLGKCVRWNQCPTCKRPNEMYDPCPAPCPPRTCDVNEALILCQTPPQLGDPDCTPACRCIDGFVKNQTGICIPKNKCPKCTKPNQVYDSCIAPCPPRRCDVDKRLIKCAAPPKPGDPSCEAGCRCADGYVTDSEGVCIPEEECPVPCNGDPNAVPGCGVYCNQRCRDIGKKPGPCILICRANACDCRKGYYFDENTGQCVLPKQCTPQCPLNEVYSNCVQGDCRPQNCSQVGSPVPCPRIDPKFCKKGCLCKEGYARNNKGVCVPTSDCGCNGDPNKVPGCGVYCNQRCGDIGKEPNSCIDICYEDACDCRKGYYFDESTGLCVLPKDCTPQCPKNEWYSECTQGNCSPQKCSEVESPLACPRIDPKYCKKGCLCNEGYVRNNTGVCIPISDCAALSPTCGKNEEYNTCANSQCGPQTCDDLGYPVPCENVEPEDCTQGCRCKPGYVRNHKEICIASDKCPSCGGDPNAKPGCGGNCNKRCSNVGKKPGVCALSCILNGCDCKDGYYYDESTKQCVKPEDCSPTCPLNEVYSECTNGGCQARNCSQYGKPVPCIKMDPKYCKKGCVCTENYLRASNGKCIPQEDCKEACNGPNEEYSECSWNCPPQTCESLDRVGICLIREGHDCKPTCRCKPGFFRNKIRQCITEEQCRRCNGPHEFYSCGGACDNVCATLDKQSQDNCPIVNIKCNEMCYCEEGYARAENKTCIPICDCDDDLEISCGGDPNAIRGCGVNCGRHCSDLDNTGPVACPAICRLDGCDCKNGYYYDDSTQRCVKPEDCAPQCPLNERYDDCPGSSCAPQYCEDLGNFDSCTPLSDDEPCPTEPGCVCVDGYVRDEDDICIPKNECPSCGGDPNARSGCGVNCGKRCRDLVKPGPCLKICYPDACDCVDGFYFDSNQNKCVPAEECTDVCGKNEVLEDCSNPTCRAKNCSQVGFPLDCDEKCVKGCVCQNGYVRSGKGVCIPIEECPSCGGDSNAQSGCGTNCGRRCPNNYINPKFCPRIACVPQLNKCDCKEGFFYDINTESCVKLEECSPRCDDSKFEVYDSCVNGGCGPKNCSQLGKPMICIDPIKCYQGCKCKEGYYRLDNGTCVPENMCPYSSCGNDPNAQPGCGYNCGKRCPNNYINPKLCPRIQCKPTKCDCKDGYYYDINTKSCVELEDCSRETTSSEED